MMNSIAIVFSPPRAVALCLGLVLLYGLAVLGAADATIDGDAFDGSDVSVVELLQ